MKTKDCIVVGGGIIGMSTARELAKKGYSVCLIDSGYLGQEASSAAGGILSSMRPWSEKTESAELSNQAISSYQAFVEELKEETNIDSEYIRSGLLLINRVHIEPTRIWANMNQVKYNDSYSDSTAGMLLPNDVLHLPDIAQVRVPFLLRALKKSIINYNVSIHEKCEVSGLEFNSNKICSVLAGKDIYQTEKLIITAGTWSRRLLGKYAEQIDIEPVLGQMLCVKFPKQKLGTIILDNDRYLIPRLDGHVLIGSTTEHVGFEKKSTHDAKEELFAWAVDIWPDIEKSEFIKQWSGLRPGTKNGKPYIGRLNGFENVFINAGHYRKGILQAPVCAKKIADMIR